MATIFDKLYVTIQYRGDANNESGLLGFASPYTKDTPFQKRKKTQDEWAYGYGVTVTVNDDDSVQVEGEGTRGGYGRGEKWDTAMLFIANCYPRIVKNEPVEGFKIADSVRRYGWNGGGNVKWRITDPRGYDLEISSENFASIIDCATIEKGVIKGKCVWGREGSNNILLPEGSEPYQKAYVRTKLTNEKLSLNDIKRGDIVTLVTKDSDAGYRDARYMGRMFAMACTDDAASDRSLRYVLNTKTTSRYVFQDTDTKKYFCVSKPVIGAMVTAAKAEENLLTNINKVNKAINKKMDEIDGLPDYTIMMVAKESEAKKATLDLRESKFEMNGDIFAETKGKYDWYSYANLVVAQKGGDFYMNYNLSPDRYGRGTAHKKPVLFKMHKIEPDTAEINLAGRRVLVQSGSSYYRSERVETRIDPSIPFDIADENQYTVFELWVKVGDVEQRMIRPPYTLSYTFDNTAR
jgi:hypothetical protein